MPLSTVRLPYQQLRIATFLWWVYRMIAAGSCGSSRVSNKRRGRGVSQGGLQQYVRACCAELSGSHVIDISVMFQCISQSLQAITVK